MSTFSDRWMCRIYAGHMFDNMHKLNGPHESTTAVHRSTRILRDRLERDDYNQCARLNDIKENVERLRSDYSLRL